MLFDHGRKVADGSSAEVCSVFYSQSDAKIADQLQRAHTVNKFSESSGEIDLVHAELQDPNGRVVTEVTHGVDCIVALTYRANTRLANVIFGVGVHTTDFLYLADRDTEDDNRVIPSIEAGQFTIRCRIKRFPFLPGTYSLRLGVAVGDPYRIAFSAENVAPFRVLSTGGNRLQGFVPLDIDWQLDAGTAVSEAPGNLSTAKQQPRARV
jgi:hypothetical protein